jgi:outer membrane protein assembly factor BamA
MTLTKTAGAFAVTLLLSLPGVAQDVAPPPPEPLQVQEVRCAGNQQTACEFIREHLYLESGDVLDEEEVRNAELRLSALRNFDSVRIYLEKGAQRGAVIVVIDVRENSPIAMEWIAGGSFRMDQNLGVLGGRVANQNLFGTGKYLDFTAIAVMPLDEDSNAEGYEAWLRYADPQLFGSRRWFGTALAGYRKHDAEDRYGNFSRLETAQLDVTVGWRFADFSYLTLGTIWRPGIDLEYGSWEGNGVFEYTNCEDCDFAVITTYGWNSEDDLHFPTQGSAFQFGILADAGDYGDELSSHLQFRKTWSWLDSYWSFKFGGEPSAEYRTLIAESQMIALTFARPVRGGDNVRRGRWYVEPGFSMPYYSDTGDNIYEVGLKVGYRADTRMFGIVDLYLMGSVDAGK